MNNRIAGSPTWASGMVVFGGLALGAVSPAQANLLTNGDFELGTLSDPIFTTVSSGDSTTITGWTVGGRGASVDYIGSYWQAGDAPTGSRSIDLSGTLNGSNITIPNGSLSQDFATTAGQQYRVSFLLAGNPDNVQGQKDAGVQVGVDDNLFTFDTTGKSLSNMGWILESFLWTAPTTGSTTITFRSDTATQFGPALDDVSVAAVPIPAALPLFASGLAGLGWLSRRRRKLATAA